MILLIFFLVFFWMIYYGLARKAREETIKLKELREEIEKTRCKFFNETFSSNMKEEVVVKKQYVDNDSGPVKWIKRDIEN